MVLSVVVASLIGVVTGNLDAFVWWFSPTLDSVVGAQAARSAKGTNSRRCEGTHSDSLRWSVSALQSRSNSERAGDCVQDSVIHSFRVLILVCVFMKRFREGAPRVAVILSEEKKGDVEDALACEPFPGLDVLVRTGFCFVF